MYIILSLGSESMPIVTVKDISTNDIEENIQFNPKSGQNSHSSTTSNLSNVDYGLELDRQAAVAHWFCADINYQNRDPLGSTHVSLEMADGGGDVIDEVPNYSFSSWYDVWFNITCNAVWLDLSPGNYIFRVRQTQDADFKNIRNIVLILNKGES